MEDRAWDAVDRHLDVGSGGAVSGLGADDGVPETVGDVDALGSLGVDDDAVGALDAALPMVTTGGSSAVIPVDLWEGVRAWASW